MEEENITTQLVNNRNCNFIANVSRQMPVNLENAITAKGIPDSVTIFADRKNGTAVQTDMGITSHSLYIWGDIFALILPSVISPNRDNPVSCKYQPYKKNLVQI